MAQRWTCTGCGYSLIYRTVELAEALFPRHACKPAPPQVSDLPACRSCGRACMPMADYDQPVCFRCDAAMEDVLMRAALSHAGIPLLVPPSPFPADAIAVIAPPASPSEDGNVASLRRPPAA